MEQETIFRRKTLDKMKSPENLNDYIRASTPGVWLILIAIVVLLAGALIWGILGRLETTITAYCAADNGTLYCVAQSSQVDNLKVGQLIRLGDRECVVESVDPMVQRYGVVAKSYGYVPEERYIDEEVITFRSSLPIQDGYYTLEVVTESKAPISFVFN